MKAIIQVVDNANVEVFEKCVGKIEYGLLIYVGFHKNDTLDKIDKLANKIVNLRVFDNENGKIDKSLLDLSYKVLLVSQFTLYADLSSRRPGFSNAMKAEQAKLFFEKLEQTINTLIPGRVETGQFQAHMHVSSTNDGPFTLILEV